eukprot:TRINITY_DN2110_c0_g1_i1.p2 TRINITY_DN2110_c0_g1~~TRINITY_DN2110_c0_g1_i1.p2  ORF type:complete len:542 (+),score=172.83 TRINITY_DN2110_c0_g1_i1:106-1731(+)
MVKKNAKKKPMNLVPLNMSDMTNEYPAFYSVVVPQKICGSAHPSMTALEQQMTVMKRNENVKGVLSLTKNGVDGAALANCGMRYLHLPTQDKCPLTIRDLVLGSIFIDEVNNMKDGGLVLVHCREGIGRTGTMIAGWMILSMKMDAKEAVHQVRAIRPGSIHQHHQELRLYQLERVLKEDPANYQSICDGSFDESSLDFGYLKVHAAAVMARLLKRFTLNIYFFKLVQHWGAKTGKPLPGRMKVPLYQRLERSPHWKPKLTSFESYTGDGARTDALAGSFNLHSRNNSVLQVAGLAELPRHSRAGSLHSVASGRGKRASHARRESLSSAKDFLVRGTSFSAEGGRRGSVHAPPSQGRRGSRAASGVGGPATRQPSIPAGTSPRKDPAKRGPLVASTSATLPMIASVLPGGKAEAGKQQARTPPAPTALGMDEGSPELTPSTQVISEEASNSNTSQHTCNGEIVALQPQPPSSAAASSPLEVVQSQRGASSGSPRASHASAGSPDEVPTPPTQPRAMSGSRPMPRGFSGADSSTDAELLVGT